MTFGSVEEKDRWLRMQGYAPKSPENWDYLIGSPVTMNASNTRWDDPVEIDWLALNKDSSLSG